MAVVMSSDHDGESPCRAEERRRKKQKGRGQLLEEKIMVGSASKRSSYVS